MKTDLLRLALFCAALALPAAVNARLFTDDQGRQVEAELVGLRGANVVLATQGVRGQWPVARLSPADQQYVSEWKASHATVAKLNVRLFERDGMGEKGAFAPEEKGGPALPKDLPIGPKTEVKVSYKHYGVEINNPAAVDALNVKADYVLYVLFADGSVGTNAGSQTVKSIPAGRSVTIKTEGITTQRTKTTQMKLSVSSNSVSVGEKTARSRDQFGGGWVRVSGVDGSRLGEARRLTPDLEKLDPPWVETPEKEEIPVLSSLDDFKELIKRLLPAKPPGEKGSKGLPLPPGFPPRP